MTTTPRTPPAMPAAGRSGASAASRVFVVFLTAVVVIAALLGLLLALDAHTAERTEAEELVASVAQTVAAMPMMVEAAGETDAQASVLLQPVAARVMDETPIDFVTIMRPDGIRLAHRDPAEIGKLYLGSREEPLQGRAFTEEYTGTLGASLRTIVPVMDASGDVVILVSAGVTLESVWGQVWSRLPFVIAVAVALAALGVAAAWIARRLTRQVAGDLPASAVRDAVSSYESVRTLGEALRAQTHEHGNRMHTAVALIELGRPDDAVALLTETTRVSQDLVDRVLSRRDGDPTVAALLLGKASQSKERGVAWDVDVDPIAPRSVLGAVDAVSVVGNLIDNAIDAAADGPEPRWVRVAFSCAGDGLGIVVSDSGEGVPAALRDRIYVHGFSTKPAGAAGRGVGLALVRDIVVASGGTLTLDDGAPTTFRVTLPPRESGGALS